jgi:predicted metal-dependent peptidase
MKNPSVKGLIKPCDLTAKEEKQWSESRAKLLWDCPAFAHIFYTMLNKKGDKHIAIFTREKEICPIAATDGRALIANPDMFFKFNLNQRVFIGAHEIAHCMFNHLDTAYKLRQQGFVPYKDGTKLPYIHELMNEAQDYFINDMLIESKVGEMPALPDDQGQMKQVGLWDQSIGTCKQSVMDIYRTIYQQEQAKGNIKKGKLGRGGKGGFDVHLDPGASDGQDPGQAMQDRNDTEWRCAVAAAMQTAKVQGKLPAAMERMFGELLEPQVDWTDKIEGFFACKVGSGRYDYRRCDRRLVARDIYAPGKSGFGANCVVVAIDTSGSVWNETEMFLAEVGGILEDVRPKNIVVMWCDARIGRVDEVQDGADIIALRYKKATGGGGTSFVPVFKEIEKMGLDPDALVYLTDTYGTFPAQQPKYPVLWGSIVPNAKVPFGEIIDVPKQAPKK